MTDGNETWTYDPEANAWYFPVGERKLVANTHSLGLREVNIDMDENGRIVGVEVL